MRRALRRRRRLPGLREDGLKSFWKGYRATEGGMFYVRPGMRVYREMMHGKKRDWKWELEILSKRRGAFKTAKEAMRYGDMTGLR